jgi:hypothetical protein
MPSAAADSAGDGSRTLESARLGTLATVHVPSMQ